MSSRTLLALSVAVSAMAPMAITAPAMAQAEEADESSPRDQIVVTARRREESLQDTPLAVSAFGEDQLVRAGSTDITTVTRLTPNTQVEPARGTNSTIIAFIRGVGQQDPLWGYEPGVGLYVDDVYVARPQGAILDIFDIERLEVLRGPQGTLYGRNTIGGAVKYVTRKLNTEAPELRAKVQAGSYAQFDAIVSGSIPLSDTFAIGGAIANYERDGFGKNLFSGADHYNKDVLAGRVSAEWTPTPDLFFRLAADRTEDDSNAKHGHRLLPGVVGGEPITDDEYDTRAGLGDKNEVITQGLALTAEWDVNDNLTLKSITAARDGETFTPIDFDALPARDFDVPAFYEDDQFSQELQALFEFGRLSGVAGLYYLDANARGAFDLILVDAFNAPTFGDVDTESMSAFADVTFDINDQWELSVGGRYTEDERSAEVIRRTYFDADPSPFLGGSDDPARAFLNRSDFSNTRTDDRFSPRASISYKPNDDLSLYASFAEGFKSGGFDPRGFFVAADQDGDGDFDDADLEFYSPADLLVFNGFEPEIVQSYEVGAKGSFLGGNLLLNTAVFLADYTDQQITVQDGVDTDGDGENDNFVSTVFNAGEVEYFGVEIEGVAYLSDALSIDFMLGYIDAEIQEILSNGEDISDAFVVQNTPELSWRLGGNYVWDLPNNQGDMTLSASVNYRDEFNIFNVDNEGSDTPALGLPPGTPPLDPEDAFFVDASAVWDLGDGHWQIGAFGRNLLDERQRIAGYNFAGSAALSTEGVYSAFYTAPRTFTVSLQYER